MTKFIAEKKLRHAVRRKDKHGVKKIYKWASKNLSRSEFASLFVANIESYPQQDCQWFKSNFRVGFQCDDVIAYVL
jgi:hypothetical protein